MLLLLDKVTGTDKQAKVHGKYFVLCKTGDVILR